MRLDKYLADSLKISRADAKKHLKNKLVKVNNEIITNINFVINDTDIVLFNDKQIKYQKYIYLMLNKPSGYLSATQDSTDKTVMELIPNEYLFKDLSIVGRLDKDTEGLLLLTNDGDLIHHLTSPKHTIDKIYYVEHTNKLCDDASMLVQEGMNIDDYHTLPGVLDIIDDTKCYLTIHEGKFHQVKKMIEKMGSKVTYLKRVQIKDLKLDIELGKLRELTNDEVNSLKE